MDAWEFNINAYKAFGLARLVFGPLCSRGDVSDLGQLNEQDVQARPRCGVIDWGEPAVTPSTVLFGLPAVEKLMVGLFRRLGPANPEDMQHVQLGDVYCRSDHTGTEVGKDVGGGQVYPVSESGHTISAVHGKMTRPQNAPSVRWITSALLMLAVCVCLLHPVAAATSTIVLPGNLFLYIRDGTTVLRLGANASAAEVIAGMEEMVFSMYQFFQRDTTALLSWMDAHLNQDALVVARPEVLRQIEHFLMIVPEVTWLRPPSPSCVRPPIGHVIARPEGPTTVDGPQSGNSQVQREQITFFECGLYGSDCWRPDGVEEMCANCVRACSAYTRSCGQNIRWRLGTCFVKLNRMRRARTGIVG